MANVRTASDGATIRDWFDSVPMVTKILVFGTLSATCLANLGLVNPGTMAASMERVWYKFEVHRLVLPIFWAGDFSFNYAWHLYILYENCRAYEATPFNTGAAGTSADFLWLVVFGLIVMHLINYFFEAMFFSEPMLYMIIYVWSRREPDRMTKIWFFGPFKAIYLPWIFMALRILMKGSPIDIIIGIIAGHVYYFVYEVLPAQYPSLDMRYIATPWFCRKLTELWSGMSIGPRNPPPPPGTAAAAGLRAEQRVAGGAAGARGGNMGGPSGVGYSWGQGRTLGTR